MEALGQNEVSDSQRKVVCIAQDSFYKELSDVDAKRAAKGCFDFDHPSKLAINHNYTLYIIFIQ